MSGEKYNNDKNNILDDLTIMNSKYNAATIYSAVQAPDSLGGGSSKEQFNKQAETIASVLPYEATSSELSNLLVNFEDKTAAVFPDSN